MYSLDEFMSGKPLPVTALASKVVSYTYGVHVSPSGKYARFVVRDPKNLPEKVVEFHTVEGMDSGEVQRRATELVENWRQKSFVPPLPPPKPPEEEAVLQVGSIAMHSDSAGEHMAIILQVGDRFCDALFFTSNPSWAGYARRATKEELAFAGYVHSRTTYLSRVVRATSSFQACCNAVPSDYIEKYLKEFPIGDDSLIYTVG